MKTVRFVSDDPKQKQFATEVRKRVNHYFKENGISNKGNVTMYIKALAMLTLYIAPFVLILTSNLNYQWGILFAIVMGIGEAGIGMSVMHDAAHGSFSDKKWVNRIFASTMFLLGSNTFNWKIQHNLLHHTFTNIYGYDQDIETKAVIRLCKYAPLKKFHRFQHIYSFFFYGLMTLSKLVTDFGQLLEYNKVGITQEQQTSSRVEVLKLITTKVLYVSVIIGLPLWLSDFTWWQILVGFSIMHITAGMIMSTIFQTAHVVEATEQVLPNENGVIHNDWMVHQLRSTSDFARNNRLLGWYIGGLNFQIEHHLFTNICHVHYPKIAPIVEETAREFEIPYLYHPTFIAALASHYRKLKELGKPYILPHKPEVI